MKADQTNTRAAVMFWAAILAVVVIFVVFIAFAADKGNRDAAERAATWSAWEARMRENGCKVASFTSERSNTYAVWRCPDGDHYLGRPQ